MTGYRFRAGWHLFFPLPRLVLRLDHRTVRSVGVRERKERFLHIPNIARKA
jgi:hypothetical protein